MWKQNIQSDNTGADLDEFTRFKAPEVDAVQLDSKDVVRHFIPSHTHTASVLIPGTCVIKCLCIHIYYVYIPVHFWVKISKIITLT